MLVSKNTLVIVVTEIADRWLGLAFSFVWKYRQYAQQL